MSRRRSTPGDYEEVGGGDDNAALETASGTETAGQLSDRGITIPSTLEKLHRQHTVLTITTILTLLACVLQSYAVANTGWVEDPLSNSTHAQSRINRSAFWRMFLLPWVSVFALVFAKHLFHDNLSASLSVGNTVLLVWNSLYFLWAVWLAAEAFWWCSGHKYDYCTDTVTEDLTTSYWIFISASWAGMIVAVWTWFEFCALCATVSASRKSLASCLPRCWATPAMCTELVRDFPVAARLL